jgi:hypothetical protein
MIVDRDHTLAQAVFSIAVDVRQGITRDPIQSVKYACLSTKSGDLVVKNFERMKLFIELSRYENFGIMITFSRDYAYKK